MFLIFEFVFFFPPFDFAKLTCVAVFLQLDEFLLLCDFLKFCDFIYLGLDRYVKWVLKIVNMLRWRLNSINRVLCRFFVWCADNVFDKMLLRIPMTFSIECCKCFDAKNRRWVCAM